MSFHRLDLTHEDLYSPTWAKLRDYYTARLAHLREENDSGDEPNTAKRRGRIAEVKELLALDPTTRPGIKAPPAFEPAEDHSHD